MSVEQLEDSLRQLPTGERRRFVDWLFDHEEELLGSDYLHPEIQAELLRRRDEVLAHPEKLEPWEGTTERVRARLLEIRNPKAAGR